MDDRDPQRPARRQRLRRNAARRGRHRGGLGSRRGGGRDQRQAVDGARGGAARDVNEVALSARPPGSAPPTVHRARSESGPARPRPRRRPPLSSPPSGPPTPAPCPPAPPAPPPPPRGWPPAGP